MATNDTRSLREFLVAAARRFDGDRGFLTAGSLAFTMLLAIVPTITVALALLYLLVPNRRVAPGHAMIGAMLAGVSFEVAKRGFGWCVGQFPTYTMIYGAFAVLPVFLVWVYVSWVVVLAGATVTAMLGERGRAT